MGAERYALCMAPKLWYRTLFERESDAIFIYDPESTNIIEANEATSRMYGYDKDARTVREVLDGST
jgi:PAS domain S-box-containing protein